MNKNVLALILFFLSNTVFLSQSSLTGKSKLSIFLEGDKQWTGIAVSKSGRMFVCFPRWTDNTPVSVGEIVNKKVIPFPDTSWNNQAATKNANNKFVCVQSVSVDSSNILWVLDTGYELSTDSTKSAHLYAFDLNSNSLLRDYTISSDKISSRSYLNDLAIDKKTNNVFFSDSRVGGIVILDLTTGKIRRVLSKHRSTLAEVNQITIEGYVRSHPVHSDGITLDPQKKYLYYCSLMGKYVYRISTSDLLNKELSEEQLGEKVERFAETGANDGIAFDRSGNLYLTSLEKNGISMIDQNGSLQVVASDHKIQWPDSFAFDQNNDLFFTTSQIHIPIEKRGTYKIFKLRLTRRSK